MDNEEVVLEPEVETEAETVNEEVEVDASALIEQLEREKEARQQLTARAKAAEAENKVLKAKAGGTAPLAVEDYIDISTALDGLDQREKARLAEEHKLSGKPLKAIREGEDYQLWQSAYRAKMEKESALRPSATQQVEDAPQSLADRLRGASIEEKEAILREAGRYKEFRPRADRTNIGNIRSH